MGSGAQEVDLTTDNMWGKLVVVLLFVGGTWSGIQVSEDSKIQSRGPWQEVEDQEENDSIKSARRTEEMLEESAARADDDAIETELEEDMNEEFTEEEEYIYEQARAREEEIGCIPVPFHSVGGVIYYKCRGRPDAGLTQDLDIQPTDYGWRIPYQSNGQGIFAYVPEERTIEDEAGEELYGRRISLGNVLVGVGGLAAGNYLANKYNNKRPNYQSQYPPNYYGGYGYGRPSPYSRPYRPYHYRSALETPALTNDQLMGNLALTDITDNQRRIDPDNRKITLGNALVGLGGLAAGAYVANKYNNKGPNYPPRYPYRPPQYQSSYRPPYSHYGQQSQYGRPSNFGYGRPSKLGYGQRPAYPSIYG